MAPQTLYDKIFKDHIVDQQPDGTVLLYIDRHLVHEVTSPQAFEGLRNAGRKVRRLDCTMTTVDHNIPTTDRSSYKNTNTFIQEADSRTQVLALEKNVKEFGLDFFGMTDKRQGIVHVIGPEQGFTLPGTTVVCGDSHTSTHGAFGALAFGIGTSEVEHVLATQTLLQRKAKNMLVKVEGNLAEGVTSKDVILHIIGKIGTAGGTGCVIEFSGSTIRSLSMEARMSICNMSIEGGARAGLIAPDEITYEYIKGRPLAPDYGTPMWDKAVSYWKNLCTDIGAKYDVEVHIDAKDIIPTVTWGTSPQDVIAITGRVPDPSKISDVIKRQAMERSLEYMGLEPNTPMEEIKIDKVFIGSCTNSRMEDLRSAARIIHGRKVAKGVDAMVVPGSGLIKYQAELEGLDKIFKEAGFKWREAGCSMCLGMNPDILAPKERCASTSNRNFEGRQGPGGRTHLMSPAMAAAAAIHGTLFDVRKLDIDNKMSMTTGSIKVDISNGGNQEVEVTSKVGDEGFIDTNSASTNITTPTGMPKFTILKGIAAPLEKPNVDTDMIIPKQFLKTIKRTGLGNALFYEIRFDRETGKENPNFILNQDPYRNAKILIGGENFGCGSSREHAPWALLDFGIRCVIAPSFADIFFNNMFKNGMLPIKLSNNDVEKCMNAAKNGKEFTIDLEKNMIHIENGDDILFEVEEFRRHCLLNGFDDIGLTMQKESKITTYEKHRSEIYPWLEKKYPGIKGKNITDKISDLVENKMDW